MSQLPTLDSVRKGETRAVARALSMIENEIPGSESLLEQLDMSLHVPVVGFTGPPGAGKSSLVNALVERWADQGLKTAILAVDPSSPFNFGSVLGDRLRMAGLFMHPLVYIRSVSSRGSLGGLSANIIGMVELLRNAGFDRIVIETVGVGQSEVEIAGIADTTIVVTVPESGDEVQTMKSGVMEIADIFVVNKSDRDGSDRFARFLEELSSSRHQDWKIPVVKTIAISAEGLDRLDEAIHSHTLSGISSKRKYLLLAEKIENLVVRHRMKGFDTREVAIELETAANQPGFNLYLYSKKFY